MEGTNLLGKSHKQYVQDQIKIRQEKLGKTTKDNNDISWLNSKTSWVRLASSVDIKNTTTREVQVVLPPLLPPESTQTSPLPPAPNYIDVPNTIDGVKVGEKRLNLLGLDESFMGSTLSQKMVLYGGLEQASFGDTNKLNKKSGITSKLGTSTASSTSVYTSKNGDFGLVAMPGIESVDIKSKSMGSLREANISIRVNDAEQLELIETIYLRLGYSLFLEWGNSSYYNNKGEYVKGASVEPTLLYDFLNPSEKLKKCPTNFIEKIEDQRKKSNGNYDALFGRVSNFSWEFDPSGFYNVSLTIISWGDIIESLKIDSLYPGVDVNNPSNENAVEKKDQSLLNGFIHEASQPNQKREENNYATTSPGYVPGLKTDTTRYSVVKDNLIAEINYEKYTQFRGTTKENVSTNSDYSSILDYDRDLTNSKGKIISGTATFNSNTYHYVRLGDILDFIKSRLSLYVEDCNTPIVGISTLTSKNFCYNPKINVSADPSKVIIRRSLPSSEQGLETLKRTVRPDGENFENIITNTKIFEGVLEEENLQLEPFDKVISVESGRIDIDTDGDGVVDQKDVPTFKKVTVGLLMNIYFEKEFLYSTIDQYRDNKTKKLALYKFLKALLDTANDCLGGVNKLDLRVKDDQTLEIYDQTPLYGIKEPEENPTIFNIYGLKKSTGEGSFITNFGLKTELTNEFATTVTIGAQANGSVVGEDATMLSRWNFGLIDRFYPKKLDSYRKSDQQTSGDPDEEEFQTALKKMFNLWSDYSLQKIGSEVLSVNGGVNNKTITGYFFPLFQTNNYTEYVKIQKDFFQSIIKLESKKQKVLSNQMGMLPINLNLEMDGISGIRIYDQIHVDTRFLPSYYPDNLIFIIKGLSQTFNGNRWITKIDTIAQPKVQFGKELDLSQSSNLRDSLKEKIDQAAKENVAEVKTRSYESKGEIYKPLTTIIKRGIDDQGNGAFGAPRGEGLHLGVDLTSTPGETVFAPIRGTIIVDAPAYNNGDKPNLRKVKIIGKGEYYGYSVSLLYVKGDKDLIPYDKQVNAGDPIGYAQDMASSYDPGMTNHIHFALYNGIKPINIEELLPELV